VSAVLDRWLALLTRYRRAALALAVLVVTLLATQIRPPVFAGSMVDEIDASNETLARAAIIAEARGNMESIVLLLTPGDSTVAEATAELERLRAALAVLSPEITMRSLESLRGQMIVYDIDDDAPVMRFLDALREGGAPTIVARDRPLFAALILAPASLDEAVVERLDDYAFGHGIGVAGVLAGAALERDVASGLRTDLRRLIPLIVVSMLVVLGAAFGHWRALVLPVFATISSTVVVFSLLSLEAITINLVTLLALPIVLIVALANSCHFLAKSAAVSGTGEAREAAVTATLGKVSVPYLISSLTTAVALASLGFNEIGPIRDLGLLAAVALSLSFVLCMLVAPWSLYLFLDAPSAPLRRSRIYRAFSESVLRYRRAIAVGLAALSLAGAVAAPTLAVHSDARVFFPDSAAFTEAFTLFESSFYAFSPVRVVVTPTAGAVASVETLRYAGELRAALAELPGVIETLLTPAASGGGFLVTAILDDQLSTPDALALLDAAAADAAGRFDVVYSSPQLVYEAIDQLAMSSLAQSLGVSVLIIFGAIALLFRSARSFVATVAANAAPLLVVCVAIWWRGEPLNLVTAFVFLVALGVIVDDTIHILYRHRLGEQLAGSSIEFSVVLTTIMLCTGLLLCMVSDFPTTRQFAAYCALALATAVISDLSILPLINRRSERRE